MYNNNIWYTTATSQHQKFESIQVKNCLPVIVLAYRLLKL